MADPAFMWSPFSKGIFAISDEIINFHAVHMQVEGRLMACGKKTNF